MTSFWKKLPWIEPFLEPIQAEYTLQPPNWTLVEPEETTFKYIYSVAEEDDPFDTGKLKQECANALRTSQATVFRSVCPLGEILLVSLHKDPTTPTWNLWWRCVRLLLTQGKRARILLFGNPTKRMRPLEHQAQIVQGHINGGATYPCNEKTIVVYRKEEMTRVLLHELLHASCSDPYEKSTPHIEADTEAWAELILCAMAAKGKLGPFITHMNNQLQWSVNQAALVKQKHNVHSDEQYAWRYLVGRLDVWNSLGISIPPIPTTISSSTSLRFTICEPNDD